MKIVKNSLTADLIVQALLEYRKHCINQIELYKKQAPSTNTYVLIDILKSKIDEIDNTDDILKQLGYVEKVFNNDDIPF